ncbi:hypothetical protein QJS04_geneDACA000026 [Acorus gramineus]|uniref:Uncharacterized protein n=1 Tax=Acorus gramineus TaxID=55184 RepID=A0AAV9AP41_ACOGR|nr:hypothetical protein QJS04_geneDACA000026 [Acorus gramineus]
MLRIHWQCKKSSKRKTKLPVLSISLDLEHWNRRQATRPRMTPPPPQHPKHHQKHHHHQHHMPNEQQIDERHRPRQVLIQLTLPRRRRWPIPTPLRSKTLRIERQPNLQSPIGLQNQTQRQSNISKQGSRPKRENQTGPNAGQIEIPPKVVHSGSGTGGFEGGGDEEVFDGEGEGGEEEEEGVVEGEEGREGVAEEDEEEEEPEEEEEEGLAEEGEAEGGVGGGEEEEGLGEGGEGEEEEEGVEVEGLEAVVGEVPGLGAEEVVVVGGGGGGGSGGGGVVGGGEEEAAEAGGEEEEEGCHVGR